MRPDLFEAPDYYNIDDLLTEEHKLIRDAARAWVKRDVSPIIRKRHKMLFFLNLLFLDLQKLALLDLIFQRSTVAQAWIKYHTV